MYVYILPLIYNYSELKNTNCVICIYKNNKVLNANNKNELLF